MQRKLANGRRLQGTFLFNEDPTEILKRKSILEDVLTLEDINQAAKEYFTVENMQRFVLMPESYKPKETPNANN